MQSFDWHLDNWIRWCRKRNWLPVGHVSQIALLIRQAKEESKTATDAPIPAYEIQAMEFNRLIMMLPKRHMDVFLLNHLDRGILGQRIVYTRDASVKYRLAGLSKTTFYERAKEADSMIKRWMQ